MPKRTYESCPQCGKKGVYASKGYVGPLKRPPEGTEGIKRCRYCSYVTISYVVKKNRRSASGDVLTDSTKIANGPADIILTPYKPGK